MKIKTAEEIIESKGIILTDWSDMLTNEAIDCMKEYAAQFIDLAANEAVTYNNSNDTAKVIKVSILKIKKQIK